ncbi:MAG: DUF418 domain-containing protein, partial [Alphaproteobacteria bacterium]
FTLIVLQLVGRFDALSVGMIALIVLCAGSVPVSRPMPWAEEAGKLSFSLFITHLLVSTLWFGVLHVTGDGGLPMWARWMVWAGALPAALITACIFDRIIDQPVQARIAPWLKRTFTSRRDRYPEPAPSV